VSIKRERVKVAEWREETGEQASSGRYCGRRYTTSSIKWVEIFCDSRFELQELLGIALDDGNRFGTAHDRQYEIHRLKVGKWIKPLVNALFYNYGAAIVFRFGWAVAAFCTFLWKFVLFNKIQEKKEGYFSFDKCKMFEMIGRKAIVKLN